MANYSREKIIEIVLHLIHDEMNKTHTGQYPLEKKLGLSRGSINNWEKHANGVSVEALINIADYFDVSIDYLVGRTDKKETNK